jgi:iron complex outermembrane receptor protein
VSVTASRYERRVQESPASVIVITREQIAAIGARSVNEAIMRLAGVPGLPSLSGGGEYTLDLAGFGDTVFSNTVFVIDGVALKDGDALRGPSPGFPIEQVERIEIQRGASSVLYGEGAVAGVIQIVTRAGADGFSKGSGGSAAIGFGTWNTQEYRASAFQAGEQFKLDVAGVTRRSDGDRDNAEYPRRLGAAEPAEPGRARGHRAFAEVDNVASKLPGSLTLAQFAADPRQIQGPTHRDDRATSNQRRFGGFAQTDWQGTELRLTLSRRARDTGFTSTQYRIDSTVDADYAALQARRAFELGDAASVLLAGIEQSGWRMSRHVDFAGSPADARLDSRATGAYQEDLEFSGTGTRLSAGVRSERIQRRVDALTIADRMTGWETGVSQPGWLPGNLYARLAGSYRLPGTPTTSPARSSTAAPACPRSMCWYPRPRSTRRSAGSMCWARTDGSGCAMRAATCVTRSPMTARSSPTSTSDPTRRESVDLDAMTRLASNVEIAGTLGMRRARFVSGPWAGNRVPLAPQAVASLTGNWRVDARQTFGATLSGVGSQFIVAGDFANTARIPADWTADLHYRLKLAPVELGLTGAQPLQPRLLLDAERPPRV